MAFKAMSAGERSMRLPSIRSVLLESPDILKHKQGFRLRITRFMQTEHYFWTKLNFLKKDLSAQHGVLILGKSGLG